MKSKLRAIAQTMSVPNYATQDNAKTSNKQTSQDLSGLSVKLQPVILTPGDLVSKWGFEDGDFGYDQIESWARNGYWAQVLPQEKDIESADSAIRMYLSQRAFLIALVERHLNPILPPGSRLVRIRTVHNPIRAETTIDENHEDYKDANDKLTLLLESAEDVVISGDEISNLCEELFPFRTNSWLAMYQALWSNFHLVENIRKLSKHSKHLIDNDSNTFLSKYVDQLSENHCNDELILGAEMISQLGDVRDHKTVENVLASCRKLLR